MSLYEGVLHLMFFIFVFYSNDDNTELQVYERLKLYWWYLTIIGFKYKNVNVYKLEGVANVGDRCR